MGFFSKLKEGLKKTKDNIGKKIFAAFSGRALDDDFYEELEEAMLTADMGVTATEQILDEFKDEVYREKITDTEKAKNLLKRIMVDSISYDIPDYDYPLVILLAGAASRKNAGSGIHSFIISHLAVSGTFFCAVLP